MATEGGEKPEVISNQAPTAVAASSKIDLIVVLLRVLAFLSALSATLVMALNKQTKTITVATIGTVPLQATLTAKFQHTPAFVYEWIHIWFSTCVFLQPKIRPNAHSECEINTGSLWLLMPMLLSTICWCWCSVLCGRPSSVSWALLPWLSHYSTWYV